MFHRVFLALFAGLATLLVATGGVAAIDSGPRLTASKTPRGRAALAAARPVESPATVAASRAAIDQYCVGCHNQRLKTAGLALDTVDITKPADNGVIWEKVVRKLRGGLMPPAGVPRPAAAARDALVSYLEAELDRAATAQPNAGRTDTLHRLNRAEYGNAIHDLLALDVDVSTLLPADDASFGFDNMAGVLKISQSLVERYLLAALKISRTALGSPMAAPSFDEFRVSNEVRQDGHLDGLPFGTRGGTLVHYYFPHDAQYDVDVKLMCGPPAFSGLCDGSGGFADPHQLEVSIDGQRLKLFTLPVAEANSITEGGWKVRVPIKAGQRDVAVTFLERSAFREVEGVRQRFEKPNYLSNNLGVPAMALYQPGVATVTISGPFDSQGPGSTASRRRILTCHPSTAAEELPCAKTILSTLARRAYRRPVNDADLGDLIALYKNGRADGFEGGIEKALRAILVNPNFLFRIERDPANIAPNTNYRLSDLDLASRLSFFLWSSLPDEELLSLAVQGKLQSPGVLDQQVRRMLADRSQAFVSNFVGQWLQVRNIDAKRMPDGMFPNFDEGLRQAFRRETELFFASILHDNRSMLDMLTANYTFVNERLAQHYGIPNVKGTRFRKVTIPDDNPRRGLLGQGSILLVTSHAIRTSPVLRGKWILINILGTPPPDPPDVVPALTEKPDGSNATFLSIRDRMAAHRKNPPCAGCHAMIDPLGFALENFDPIGQWRDRDDSGRPVDASGVLPDGTAFTDLASFQQLLMSHPERFVRTLTEKLLTYSLGRGLESYDMPAVRRIVREAEQYHYGLLSIVQSIVNSTPFQMRRSESAPSAVSASAARR